MGLLREKLWGKSKPLREKLATAAKGTLSVVSGRAPIYGAASALTNDDEDTEKKASAMKQEVASMKEMHSKMGYESDELGNRTTAKQGVNTADLEKATGGKSRKPSLIDRAGFAVDKAIKKTGKFASNIVEGNKIEYTAPDTKQIANVAEAEVKPEFDYTKTKVPQEYHKGVSKAVDHLNRFSKEPDDSGRQYDEVSPQEIIDIFNAENGGEWDPKRGNKEIDYGATQLNISKRKDLRNPQTVWGSSWNKNFKDEYGEFNEDDPTHQVLGGSIVYAFARQELTDMHKAGKLKRQPTKDDFLVAYNMDAKQVADAINGEDYTITVTSNDGKKKVKSLQQQYSDYLKHVKTNSNKPD